MNTGPRTGPNKRIRMKGTYRALNKTNGSVSLLHWAGRVGFNWWIDKFMEVFSLTTLQNVSMSSHMHLRILGIAVICGFHIFKLMNMNTGTRTGTKKRIHMKDTYRAIKKTNYSVSLLHWAGRIGLNWLIDKFIEISLETLQSVTMSSHMHLRTLGIAVICGFHIFKPMNMNTGPRTGPNKRIHMKDTYAASSC